MGPRGQIAPVVGQPPAARPGVRRGQGGIGGLHVRARGATRDGSLALPVDIHDDFRNLDVGGFGKRPALDKVNAGHGGAGRRALETALQGRRDDEGRRRLVAVARPVPGHVRSHPDPDLSAGCRRDHHGVRA